MSVEGLPMPELRSYPLEHRGVASRAWQRLLEQEEGSRLLAERLPADLARLGAPAQLLASSRRIADDEARHVDLCAQVIRSLGFTPSVPRLTPQPLPEGGEAFQRAMAEIVVAGFAVGETMSVGAFAAVRAGVRASPVRTALTEILRDEVRHGAFGEEAGAWLLRDWSPERRRALWPACVQAMEAVEKRAGGGVCVDRCRASCAGQPALGAPSASVTCGGILRAVPRWVLPRLHRLGVLPAVGL